MPRYGVLNRNMWLPILTKDDIKVSSSVVVEIVVATVTVVSSGVSSPVVISGEGSVVVEFSLVGLDFRSLTSFLIIHAIRIIYPSKVYTEKSYNLSPNLQKKYFFIKFTI